MIPKLGFSNLKENIKYTDLWLSTIFLIVGCVALIKDYNVYSIILFIMGYSFMNEYTIEKKFNQLNKRIDELMTE